MLYKFWLIFVYCSVQIVCGDDIQDDYFFGELRSSDMPAGCSGPLYFRCMLTCGADFTCNRDKCVCGIDYFSNRNVFRTKPQSNEDSYEDDNRPVLRHHIAHFCPNLDVARDCIRTCMKVGKPAFCGKDHVCYCGHKYSFPGKESEKDAKETYADFKDLYKKYFPNLNSKEN